MLFNSLRKTMVFPVKTIKTIVFGIPGLTDLLYLADLIWFFNIFESPAPRLFPTKSSHWRNCRLPRSFLHQCRFLHFEGFYQELSRLEKQRPQSCLIIYMPNDVLWFPWFFCKRSSAGQNMLQLQPRVWGAAKNQQSGSAKRAMGHAELGSW